MNIRLGHWGSPKDVPPELRGQDIDVTYDNPIEDARRQMKTNSYKATLELVKATKEILEPSVVAQLDAKTAFRDAISGVAPPEWIFSEDEAAELMQDAEDQETAGGAAMELGAMAETMAKVQPKGSQPVAPAMGAAA
jgi:hypothetical protein